MQSQTTAIAIVIGFGLVAAAIFFSGTPLQSVDATGSAKSLVRTESRHLYGSSDAPTVIVEFSDFQCPYCARLHPTLKKIVDESEGQIAWEYRHFPLPSHPLADDAAIASECVAAHLDEESYWTYINRLFAEGVSELSISRFARDLGLADADLEACKTDESIQNIINADMAVVGSLGLNSTPSNVIVYPDGTIKTVPGALPYEQWASLLTK